MSKYTTAQNVAWLMGFGSLSPEDASKTLEACDKNPELVQDVLHAFDLGMDKTKIAIKLDVPLPAVERIILCQRSK